jgi:hypothetical protein
MVKRHRNANEEDPSVTIRIEHVSNVNYEFRGLMKLIFVSQDVVPSVAEFNEILAHLEDTLASLKNSKNISKKILDKIFDC